MRRLGPPRLRPGTGAQYRLVDTCILPFTWHLRQIRPAPHVPGGMKCDAHVADRDLSSIFQHAAIDVHRAHPRAVQAIQVLYRPLAPALIGRLDGAMPARECLVSDADVTL